MCAVRLLAKPRAPTGVRYQNSHVSLYRHSSVTMQCSCSIQLLQTIF